jgi:uncharacterized protein (DUF2141 family)
MRTAAFVVAAVLPALVAGQTPRDAAAPSAIGQGAIAGTVVADDANGRPVRRAVVTLSGEGLNGDRKTVTDDTGHFAVTALPAGRYTLSVSKAGWVTAYYGSKHPGRPVFGGAPIVLQVGQRLTTETLRMLHGSAVTGVITDAFGHPTANAQVRLLPMRVENGQRALDPMGGQAMGMIGQGAYGYTDDRGIYRLYGVLPGDYLVVASGFGDNGQDIQQLRPDDLQAARRAVQPGQSPGPTSATAPTAQGGSTAARTGPTVGYAPVYYPGTFEASNAVVVTVGANEERSGVDFALMLAHTARVKGVLLEPDGRPASGGQVQLLLPPAPSVLLSAGQFARVLPDGTFTFSGVPPGHYTIVARAPDTSAAPAPAGGAGGQTIVGGVVLMGPAGRGPLTLWATGATAVDGQDITGLALTLQHGATITGRLVFNGTTLTPPADPTHVGVRLTRASDDAMGMGMGGATAQVDATGGLKFTNVPPGSYRVDVSMNTGGRLGTPAAANALKGWSPRSAVLSIPGSTGGRDAMDLPFDVALDAPVPDLVVTLTDRVAEISGKVTDAAGHPVSAYRLVVFSTDKALWGTTGRRLKAPVPTDPDGTFRFTDLAPGEYFLAAVTDMDAGDLKDTSFLTELAAQAIRLTLAEGEKKVQNIIVPGG